MKHNIGEEICAEWLRHVRGCEFIEYNLRIPNVQGEMDVIGLNVNKSTVYACEVAVHLPTGLQYVKENRPDNVNRLIAKFRKDIEYIRKYFPKNQYAHIFMLWSPIVKNQREGSKYNQMEDVKKIVSDIRAEFKVEIELVINTQFEQALSDLRRVAGSMSKEMNSQVMRYLQIEEYLDRHLHHRKVLDESAH